MIGCYDHLEELEDGKWLRGGPSLRLYLSGPMSGLPNFNRPAFQAAREDLRSQGHFVICPTELDDVPGDCPRSAEELNWLWRAFLCRDVSMILTCHLDAIVVLPRWWQSKGSRLEVLSGLSVGLDLLEYPTLEPLRLQSITTRDLFKWDKEGRGNA